MADLSRRNFLALGAGALAAGYLPLRTFAATDDTKSFNLQVQTGKVHLVGENNPQTPVWCFNGSVPGPEIRVRQGDKLRVVVDNNLAEETTVHWHGIRLPNAMDGVPHLTQKPIAVGGQFIYEFVVPDAGTYWYHPHMNSAEQIGRGLYGALIVEEQEPIQVDRDLVWVLDDWRLQKDASIQNSFGQMHDMSHGGRIGNVATVNGRIVEEFAVRSGERIRLRLINAANARVFSLLFEEHEPYVIAIDGQPVTPHKAENNQLTLGSAMRMDVVIDMTHTPGKRIRVIDGFYRSQEYRLLDVVYSDQAPLREHALDATMQLPANPIPEPDLNNAERYGVVFGGGAMGGMQGATLNGQWVDLRTLAQQHGILWAINDTALADPKSEVWLTLKLGKSYVFNLNNNSAWPHPIHLHGHSFRVLARDGNPTTHREWQDTILLMPSEQADIAFVADNPGDWMFHCHILEHQMSGMSRTIRVA